VHDDVLHARPRGGLDHVPRNCLLVTQRIRPAFGWRQVYDLDTNQRGFGRLGVSKVDRHDSIGCRRLRIS